MAYVVTGRTESVAFAHIPARALVSGPRAQYFDAWYQDMSASGAHAELVAAALGLPADLASSSLLPWDGIADVVDALAVGPGEVFVDLACGRGGYGFEIARRSGAALIGVDFSAVAVEQATARLASDAAGLSARFQVGELTATGLPDDCATGVVCVDAMQFAQPYPAGLAECRRILAPGGRLVLTGWQCLDLDDDALPERMRHDIAAELTEAGFSDVDARHMPRWREQELGLWRTAVATDPRGDPALVSLRDEGEHTLPWLERTGRMLVTARA